MATTYAVGEWYPMFDGVSFRPNGDGTLSVRAPLANAADDAPIGLWLRKNLSNVTGREWERDSWEDGNQSGTVVSLWWRAVD